jgi:16S rRNA (cytosine1402-N4)-methyltransferase
MTDEPPKPDYDSATSRQRRPRYPGTHPREFAQRYKELDPERFPDVQEHVRSQGRTPAGTHVPILLGEVLSALAPSPGEVVADCTLGYGGHAQTFLERIAPTGRLIGLDVDAAQLDRTARRLGSLGFADELVKSHRSHFAGLPKILAREGLDGCDIILADLGVSSMQLDDPARGFSYKHNGPLDMRMDDRLPRTAADLLASLDEVELAAALSELGDEPHARRIAAAVVAERGKAPLRETRDLVNLIFRAKGLSRRQWQQQRRDAKGPALHPAARTFQALRILVNDELGGLVQFLRVAPFCLRPGGRLGIITFHSGEDRRVAAHFADGLAGGLYAEAPKEALVPSREEVRANPRARSARLRWGRRPI